MERNLDTTPLSRKELSRLMIDVRMNLMGGYPIITDSSIESGRVIVSEEDFRVNMAVAAIAFMTLVNEIAIDLAKNQHRTDAQIMKSLFDQARERIVKIIGGELPF